LQLQAHQVPASELLNATHSDRFVELMHFQTQRAQALYDEAMALLPAADRRAQRAGLIMAAIYRAVLDEIERDNFRVLHHKISLTPLRKLWLAWKTWVKG
jgi:phytoene synthase